MRDEFGSLAECVGELFGLDVERFVVLLRGGEICQLLGEHTVEEERSRSALVLKSEISTCQHIE